MLLSLHLLSALPLSHTVTEEQVEDALGRVLPWEETTVVMTFLRSTAAIEVVDAANARGRGGGSSYNSASPSKARGNNIRLSRARCIWVIKDGGIRRVRSISSAAVTIASQRAGSREGCMP